MSWNDYCPDCGNRNRDCDCKLEDFLNKKDKNMTKEFPVLYKYTSTGAVQQWQIFVEGNQFYTVEGIVDGKLTTSLPTICKPKSVGKANETSGDVQASKEAQSKFQKKLDKGYNEKLSEESKFFEPMLARNYTEVPIDWKKVADKKLRVYIQPKLDGLRCINNAEGTFSRNGKVYSSVPHLYNPHNRRLDGELYTHTYKSDFNAIVSLCKKQKPTQEELEESKKKIEFWAYDYPDHEGTFSKRYEALVKHLKDLNNPMIKLVPTYPVYSEEDVIKYHGQFMEDGYEGSIIRLDNAEYENKRSKQLLKFKKFVDEEFEIVGAVEGEGGRTGTIGKFWMRLDKDKPYSIENEVNVFSSNVKGKFDYLREIWKNKESYIGKSATVKYFNRTPTKEDGTGNCPRFPYIIKIDRESYE